MQIELAFDYLKAYDIRLAQIRGDLKDLCGLCKLALLTIILLMGVVCSLLIDIVETNKGEAHRSATGAAADIQANKVSS